MALKIDGAPDGVATTQVSVSTTPVQLVAARKSRRLLCFQDLGNLGHVFIGPDSSVTAATGVQPTSIPNPLPTAAELWAVTNTGSATVGVLELYDVED